MDETQKPILKPTTPANPPGDTPTNEPSPQPQQPTPPPPGDTPPQDTPQPKPSGPPSLPPSPPPPPETPPAPKPDTPPASGPPPSSEPPPAPSPPPTTPPPAGEDEEKPETPDAIPQAEEEFEGGLPPVVTPREKPKFPTKKLGGIIAALLLLVSLPVGVFLVQQRQQVEVPAFSSADCGPRGGLREETKDCDCGRKEGQGELVTVFVCNNDDRLPGGATGQACSPGTCGPATQTTQAEPAPSKISSEADGPGGCCRDGLPASQGGCREWEVCNISNGACADGFSCRVKPNEGCGRDTDCGPGFHCINSTCQIRGATTTTTKTYNSCQDFNSSYTKDDFNIADPNCGKNDGFSCKRGDGTPICCYKDGNCYEGQQGNCKNLGNGAIEIKKSAELLEFHCSGQTSATGSCSENRSSRGTVGPGTYTVGGDNCGGHQIDAVGLCGSYAFRGSCAPPPAPAPAPAAAGGPSFSAQCLDVKFYDTSWNKITDPSTQIKAGQKVRLAVSGNTNEPGGLTVARFRLNGGNWEQTTSKNPSNEFYVEETISAGTIKVEAQVFNPKLGWQ